MSILFFCQLNFILPFPFLIKYYHILFIIIVFWFGCDRPSRLLFFRAPLTPLFLSSSSVSLSYFILVVPMRVCLRKHSCMSSPFPIAILYGTLFFRSVKALNNWKRSAIKQILLLLVYYHYLDNFEIIDIDVFVDIAPFNAPSTFTLSFNFANSSRGLHIDIHSIIAYYREDLTVVDMHKRIPLNPDYESFMKSFVSHSF